MRHTSTMTYRTPAYRMHTAYNETTFSMSSVLKSCTLFILQAEYRLRIAQGFMVLSAMLALIYGINLYSLISNTVALQQVNWQAQSLSAGVETLDSQYLHLSSKITPDTLRAYGLEKGEVSFFISRSNSLGRMAIGGHEL